MRSQAFTSVLFVTLLAGCIPTPPPAPKSPAQPSTPEPSAAVPAAPAPIAATPEATAPEAAASPAPPMERVAAKAGVGKKGQSLKNDTGITVEPVKQLIRFEQRAVFDIQIKQALDLYKASTGSHPKTHEEFMEKVINANGIKLPELPAGQKYVFDPEQAQLMVERPQQQ